MDPTFITPFIRTTRNIFDTMFQMPVVVGDPQVKTNPGLSFDVSAIIGMSGDVEGSVVLSFPRPTAQRIVSLFTGAEVGDADEELSDAVGELVNMIAGGAKAQFPSGAVSISCPSVVIGSNHTVFGKKDVVCICIPCSCDCGEFNVEIAIRRQDERKSAPTAAAAAAR